MTNIGILENKISIVKKFLTIIYSYNNTTEDILKNDLNTKGAVERYLYLVSQATIDLSEIVISFKNLRKPTSFSEGFEILRENGYISDELCLRLISMTGFRNTLAHGYENVLDSVLIDTLNNCKNDIEEFLVVVQKIVNSS